MEEELIKNGFIKDSKNDLVFLKKSTTNLNLGMRVALITKNKETIVCIQFVYVLNEIKDTLDKWSTGFTIEEINEIYDKFNDLVS